MPPHSNDSYSQVFGSWIGSNQQPTFLCGGIPSAEPCTRFSVPTTVTTIEEVHENSIMMTSEKKRTKQSLPRRKVHFGGDIKIYQIPNAKDLPKSDWSNMYMAREEMARIHAEAWEMVELMNLGIEYAEGDDFSKRGLVDLKDESIEKRRQMRERAYKVVFGAHAYRRDGSRGGVGNEDNGNSMQTMAELYGQVSGLAKTIARRVAMYDSMAIMD